MAHDAEADMRPQPHAPQHGHCRHQPTPHRIAMRRQRHKKIAMGANPMDQAISTMPRFLIRNANHQITSINPIANAQAGQKAWRNSVMHGF